MKKTLLNAIRNKDVAGARNIVIDMIAGSPEKKETLISVKETIRSLPEIFEEDNGVHVSVQQSDAPGFYLRMREELSKNFSREKLSAFIEVCLGKKGVVIRNKGTVSEKHQRNTSEEKWVVVEERAPEYPKPSKSSIQFGWILLIAGVITTVVALCISLNFLIGIGIGVILLGTMVVYMQVQKRHIPG